MTCDSEVRDYSNPLKILVIWLRHLMCEKPLFPQ